MTLSICQGKPHLDLRYFYKEALNERPTRIGVCLSRSDCIAVKKFIDDGTSPKYSVQVKLSPLEISKKEKTLRLHELAVEDFRSIIAVAIEIMKRWIEPTGKQQFATKTLRNFFAFSHQKQNNPERLIEARRPGIIKSFIDFAPLVNIDEETFRNEVETTNLEELSSFIAEYDLEWITFLNFFDDIYESCCC